MPHFHELEPLSAEAFFAALLAECRTLYSEDMHSGLRIGGRPKVVNPFG